MSVDFHDPFPLVVRLCWHREEHGVLRLHASSYDVVTSACAKRTTKKKVSVDELWQEPSVS